MRSRAIPVILTAVLLVLPAAADAIRLEEVRQWSFPVGENPGFQLENVNGDIRVESWDGSSIEVTANIRIKAPSKSKARGLYEGIEFVTESDVSHASVRAELPRIRQDEFVDFGFGEHTAVRIRYAVKVPRGTSLNVSTVNGDIELALSGSAGVKVEAHSAHGRVLRR
jgi:DUF4097 and DUF4098 domain-containing protein YvlB